MHSSLIAWIMRAIPFGTIIMYGALGETVTEKSGNLNLGVPGIMYLGGFAGFGGFALSLLQALLLVGVYARVNHHSQAAGLGAGLVNRPCPHVANGAADCLPVQLGFKHKRLVPGMGHPHAQAGRFAIAQKCLCLAIGAG